jgi:predicted Fe-Mo cluster-binding NifX family protein/ferredoxin
MKIAVTSTGPTLENDVEVRFGRCAYFLIIDTDSMQFEAIENPNIALGGGAGIQSAQLMSEKGVKTVLTGNCGPNAFSVFGQAGIQVIVGISGSIRNAVEQFKAGRFASAEGPNVQSHFGVGSEQQTGSMFSGSVNPGMGNPGMGMGRGGGRGRGMGGGRGMGRGMGRGRGMGMGTPFPMNIPLDDRSAGFLEDAGVQNPEQELAALKRQAELLEQQKRQLNDRINQLESGNQAIAVVDSEKCTGCGICINVCPVGAISMHKYAVVNPKLCIACGACVSACPNSAITIARRKK